MTKEKALSEKFKEWKNETNRDASYWWVVRTIEKETAEAVDRLKEECNDRYKFFHCDICKGKFNDLFDEIFGDLK